MSKLSSAVSVRLKWPFLSCRKNLLVETTGGVGWSKLVIRMVNSFISAAMVYPYSEPYRLTCGHHFINPLSFSSTVKGLQFGKGRKRFVPQSCRPRE